MRTKKAIRHDELFNREIEVAISKFSQHLMSNSKWVKLIGKLVENADKVLKIEFKKVQADPIGELYIDEDMILGFDYWQNGFEGHNSLGGWLTFKEIEYIIFPKIIDKNNQIEQDLVYIEELVRNVGEFYLDWDEHELKMSCYKE
jgi:hypothetical protein